MASVAALQIRAFNNQIDYLLDGSDVIPIFLGRLQLNCHLFCMKKQVKSSSIIVKSWMKSVCSVTWLRSMKPMMSTKS